MKTPVDAFILAKLEARRWKPAPTAERREWIRRVTFDLTGPAAVARGGRGVRRRPVAACRRAGGRPAARQPPIRRALGAALAGRRPLRRDRGVRVRPAHPRRLAVPRLRDRLPEPRQAVRSLPDRADRRRRDRAGGPGVPGRLDLPPARPGPPERGESRDRPEPQRGPDRADRHPRHRVPRPDRRLRPMPQPQARTDLAEGLLPAPGLPGGDRGARHRPRLAEGAGGLGGDAQEDQGRGQGAQGKRLKGERRREGAADRGDRGARGSTPAPLADDPRHPERLRRTGRRSTSSSGASGRTRASPSALDRRASWSRTTCPNSPPDVTDPRTRLARWLARPATR